MPATLQSTIRMLVTFIIIPVPKLNSTIEQFSTNCLKLSRLGDLRRQLDLNSRPS